MEARQTRFSDLIKGEIQLKIPVYQRTYDWKTTNCKKLFMDILRLLEHPQLNSHFIGSIVYIEKGLYHVGSVNEFLVVDGQQRITTFMLMYAAIEELAKESGKNEFANQVRNQCLINQYQSKDEKYARKLILSKSDNEIFQRILDHEMVEGRSGIKKNYKYIKGLISNALERYSLDKIYQTINNQIIVVSVALDANKDNAQLIFESLNATGVDLTSGDLIRNFLLMNLDNELQTEIYNKYWYPLQSSLKQYLTDFFLNYLYMKKRTTTNIREKDVYEEFKNYFYVQFSKEDPRNVANELLRFSTYYLNIYHAVDSDPLVKKGLERLKKVESDSYYPFLLSVYEEYMQKHITNQEFYEILRTIESFIVRRSICHVPTNSLNSIFRPLFNSLDKTDFKKSLIDNLKNGAYSRRFPDDIEFKRELISGDFYNNYEIRRIILDELESFDNKEPVDVKGLTVEHVMPRENDKPENLSENWKNMLGNKWLEVWETWVNTLGNLTLSGYNYEYQDSDFEIKKNMKDGFKESRLKLNQEISKEGVWNEETMKRRAEKLADIAIQIWKY